MLHDAFSEAARLGHQWVGPQHVLLAILVDGQPSIARSVLNDLGLTHDVVEERFLASLLEGTPPIRSSIADRTFVQAAPVYYEIHGWTEGFAAANGTQPDETTTLIALCCLRPGLLGAGFEPTAILDALAERGVPVPPQRSPQDDSEIVKRRIDVPIDLLPIVRSRLLEQGLLLGFNLDVENNQAWVIIDANRYEAVRIAQSSNSS